jgi:hypothetical protein
MAKASGQAAAADLNVRAQRALALAARAKLSRLRARHRSAVRPGARERLRRRVGEATRTLRDRRSGVGWARASAFDYRLRAELHRTRAAQLAAFVAGG